MKNEAFTLAVGWAALVGIAGIVCGLIDRNMFHWLIGGAVLFGSSLIAAAISRRP